MFIRFTRPSCPAIYPRRFRPHAQAARLTLELRTRLNHWEKQHQANIDLVFFSCIYDDDFRYFHVARTLFPWRWSGLYLHCRALRLPDTPVPQTGQIPRPDIIFSHPNLDSVAILDEGVRDSFASTIAPTARNVVTFPDFCDESVSLTPAPLERKIRHAAAGKPVIASLGHLQSTKGTADLAHLALDHNNADLFFLIAGNFVRVHFTAEEIATIESATLHRENTLGIFQQIPDGAQFNAAIQASDVLYAAYRDFPNSSNILTKAAVFEKPVIVSDGHLMAERVRAFRLGEVIPEGDRAAAITAIRKITADIPAWIERNRPRWQDYRNTHSTAQLNSAFKALLSVK